MSTKYMCFLSFSFNIGPFRMRRKEERILCIPCRVVFRCIERVKTKPFCLHFGSFCYGKSNFSENGDDLAADIG